MYQVKCLNKISPLGTSRLGENYHVGEDVENPDAILVRSAAMHDMEFNKNLLAIARAGAGTNNIPVERCVQEGIVVYSRRQCKRCKRTCNCRFVINFP